MFQPPVPSKRLFTAPLLLLLSLTVACAQSSTWNAQYQQYIDQYKDCAVEQMLKWKVPASITLAQGLLESGAGRSRLAVKGNNHFGIKCHGWKGAAIYHDDDERGECFRAYASAFDSFEDHSRFLAGGQRYKGLFSLKTTDYRGWAKGLKAAGYATNPRYAQQLVDVIQLYKLYKYDKLKKYDKFMTAHTKAVSTGGQPLHQVRAYNKNYYVAARRGDTFRTIGRETGVGYRKLARYNERGRNDQLREGEIVWLKKKQKRAPKEYKDRRHHVRSGESMYSIAQRYGIRLKSLYTMNRLPADYSLRVGDELKVR